MRFLPISIVVFSLCLFSFSVAQAATYFYHNDHLGTPQVLTDENQQVVWRGEQEPFGEVTQTTNVVEQNIRFPGQYFDIETGLHYNYFRDYDSSSGRYVQSDLIGLNGGLNTYSYVSQNSLRYIDPYGLSKLTISGVGVKVVIDNPTAAQVKNELSNMPNGSVSNFQLFGHGDVYSQCISAKVGGSCSDFINSD